MASARFVKARTAIDSSGGLSTENWPSTRPTSGHVERATKELKVSASTTSGCLITSKPKKDIWVALAQFLAGVADFVVLLLGRLALFIRKIPWKLNVQMFLEKVVYLKPLIITLKRKKKKNLDLIVVYGKELESNDTGKNIQN